MNLEETQILLGEIARIDNRKLTMDTARTWHDLLEPFTLADCRDALATHRRNAPDTWLVPGHLVQIIRRGQAFSNRSPMCEHGVPLGSGCHDCTHPPDCPMCMPIPGLSDTPENRRAAVASFASQVDHRTRVMSSRHPEPEPDPEW